MYGLRLNWNYRKRRFCNPHCTCVVYGDCNGGVHHQVCYGIKHIMYSKIMSVIHRALEEGIGT